MLVLTMLCVPVQAAEAWDDVQSDTDTALWDLLLDSFDVGESSQFQVMAEKLNLTSMKALINLTFCCQQATVITDFTNLKEVGRDHYMNIHGGCASMEELEQLDGEETAILLIEDNEGTMGGLS